MSIKLDMDKVPNISEKRKNLIEEMQKVIDVNPRKEIFAALLANVAEDYAEREMKSKKI